MDGQSTNGLTIKNYNGVTYYLADSYDTCDDSNTDSQTQPGLVGFNKVAKNGTQVYSGYDTSLYDSAYEMYYYYSRISYTITFNDQHGNSKTMSIPYGTDLSADQYKNYVPIYPASLEEGEYVFKGWYLDEACQNPFKFEGATMPAKNIQLYAKWEKCSYRVQVYLDAEKNISLYNESVPFGTIIAEPDYKVKQESNDHYKNLIFGGWYYMDDGEEKRFDFNTMEIKKDIDIYAKWTSTVPVGYTIRYVIKVGEEYIDIAEPTTGVSLENITKTFIAKAGNELYDGYRTGYFPKVRSHAITMSNETANTYEFLYTQPNEVTYTVTHEFVSDDLVDIIGSTKLVFEKSTTIKGNAVQNQSAVERVNFLTGIDKDSIVKAAEKQGNVTLNYTQQNTLWNLITQMSPDSFEQELILVSDQTANVTFNWAGRNSVSMYQVVHYYQTLEGGYVAEHTQEFMANISEDDTDRVSAEPITRHGFEVDYDNSTMSGKVTKVELDDPESGLILRVYYKRQTMNYTVEHIRYGTTNSLYNDANVYSATYGEQVEISDKAKDIPGYALVNGDTSVEIVNENQKVTCIYRGLDVYFRYQSTIGGGAYFDNYSGDTVVGTAPSAARLTLMDGYELVGWYYTIDSGEPIEVPDEWIKADGKTISPTAPGPEWANKTIHVYANVVPTELEISNNVTDASFIYHISGKSGTPTQNISLRVAVNGTQTVYGLPRGEYTVSLESAWSWQQTNTSSKNVTIGGRYNSVSFTYSSTSSGYITDQGYCDSKSN